MQPGNSWPNRSSRHLPCSTANLLCAAGVVYIMYFAAESEGPLALHSLFVSTSSTLNRNSESLSGQDEAGWCAVGQGGHQANTATRGAWRQSHNRWQVETSCAPGRQHMANGCVHHRLRNVHPAATKATKHQLDQSEEHHACKFHRVDTRCLFVEYGKVAVMRASAHHPNVTGREGNTNPCINQYPPRIGTAS